jgi:hypothetical protein
LELSPQFLFQNRRRFGLACPLAAAGRCRRTRALRGWPLN